MNGAAPSALREHLGAQIALPALLQVLALVMVLAQHKQVAQVRALVILQGLVQALALAILQAPPLLQRPQGLAQHIKALLHETPSQPKTDGRTITAPTNP